MRGYRTFLILLAVGAALLVAVFWKRQPQSVPAVDQAVKVRATSQQKVVRPAPRSPVARPEPAPAAESTSEVDYVQDPVSSECMEACGSECTGGADGAFVCAPACRDDGDCTAGLACVLSEPDGVRGRHMRCLASNCSTHEDCGPGRACRFVNSQEHGLWRCEDVGPGMENADCSTSSGLESGGCALGLSCAGGRCLPDACQGNGDCPSGAMCAEMNQGGFSRCVPWCDSDADCGEGEACAEFGRTKRCIVRSRGGCLLDGCPDHEECFIDSALHWDLQTSCATSCSPDVADDCGENYVCSKASQSYGRRHEYRCYQNCAGGNACPEGWECHVTGEDEGICLYDRASASRRRF